MKMAAGYLKSFICLILLTVITGYPDYPANEYEYSIERDWLKAKEREYEGKTGNLNQNEIIVDNYLKYLKWQEFEATKDSDFPPSRPIEDMIEHIMNSTVYKTLVKLPKGGNMHTHENHQLSKRTILEIVINSTDYQYLYMLPETHPTDPWMLDFFVDPPSTAPGEPDWVKVQGSNYTIEEIYQNNVFLGILSDEAKNRPTDSRTRWQEMNVLWGRMSNLLQNIIVKERYIEEMIYASLAEGVQYIESRKHLGPDETIYVMDPTYVLNNGKRPLGDAELEINITVNIVERIMDERPEFIGMKRIMYTSRRNSFEEFQQDMERAVYLHTKYPSDILAFDMVGEEDAGNSHIFYLREFLELYNEETQRSDVALRLHTAETNWPDDLLTSSNLNDPVGTAQNTYESILLGARRFGHGLGFNKHPYLLSIIKERNLSIEVCPISNQILGFMPDLRTHPAIGYIRSGIPVVLGSDDPGTFGVDHFTLDWYDAFMAWGLDLEDMKKMAVNSLVYSGMTEEEISAAISLKWQPAWDIYIDELRNIACDITFSESPHFGSIFPQDGAMQGETNVHVFGRNFQSGICNLIICKFGALTDVGFYISQNEIICVSPEFIGTSTLEVEVSFDGGVEYVSTGLNFTYKYDAYQTTTVPIAGAQFTAPDKLLFSLLYFSFIPTLYKYFS